MKYCVKCGAEMFDDAVMCVKCGRMDEGLAGLLNQSESKVGNNSGLKTAAFILMIIGTVVGALSSFGIALAWCLPMTLSYSQKVKRGEPISNGFKICALLFVNTIAGIIMLCDNGNN